MKHGGDGALTKTDGGIRMPPVHEKVMKKIIGAASEVHHTPGYGFLEKVCQRALQVELPSAGIKCLLEPQIDVVYKSVNVG